MKHELKSYLSSLQRSNVQTHRSISVLPLTIAEALPPHYLSLKTALASGVVVITEVNEGGSVPNLKVINKSETPVLILDGEELKGAKQNRILNTTVLVAGMSELIVPVSCTEHGRWHYEKPVFEESGNVMSREMRSSKMERVSASLNENRGYNADQSAVWNEIDEMQSKHAVHSRTSAMKDVFEHIGVDLDKICLDFPYVEGQCGIYVEIEGRFAGLDVLSSAAAWKDVHAKIIRSYILEVFKDFKADYVPVPVNPDALFYHLELCEYTPRASVGLGQDIRLQGADLIGSVLSYEHTCLHTAVYPRMQHVSHERYRSPRNRV